MTVHRGAPLDDALWLAGLGTPLRRQIASLAHDDAEAAAMLDTYVRHQRGLHDGMARAFPGACDLVSDLRARGARLGLVTSKAREMGLRTLGACTLTDAFDALVFADDVANGKPDPEPVLLALDRLGVAPARDVLMVGDSPHDIEAGRRAGVATAAVLWGPFQPTALRDAGPDHLLPDFASLSALLAP